VLAHALGHVADAGLCCDWVDCRSAEQVGRRAAHAVERQVLVDACVLQDGAVVF